MRRSCRLSNKHEHRLLKQAEAVAADAAAAEAAEEAAAVYPSTVTKAIAGLTTPSLPSPSMFPDDWRMVHEYLNDGQSADGQTQPLCPTQLFQYIESECGPVGGLDGIEPLLAPSEPRSTLLEASNEGQAEPCQQVQPTGLGCGPADPMQDHMTYSQLLIEPEPEPGSAACTEAAPAATSAAEDAPASHSSFTATDQTLPLLSTSLDDVDLDVDTLDDIMWDDFEDLGFHAASHPDVVNLGPLDMNRAADTSLLSSTAYMASDMPSQAMLLPLLPANYRLMAAAEAPLFVPLSSLPTAAMPAFTQLPHHSLASQQSSESSATAINSQQHVVMPHHAPAGVNMHQVSMACSRFSQPAIAVATIGHHHQPHLQHQQQQQLNQAAAPPAKKSSKGKKAAAAAAVATEASARQAPPAATGAAAAEPAVGDLGVSEAPVKRKRGPYKKRVKKEGEEKPVKQRKKKAITMMPALEAFAKRIQPPEGVLSQHVPATGTDDGQGPSKRARTETPTVSRPGTDALCIIHQQPLPEQGPVNTNHIAAAAAAASSHCLPQPAAPRQEVLQHQVAKAASMPEGVPIIAAPRHFLQAAMQARLNGQSLQAAMVSLPSSQPASAMHQHPQQRQSSVVATTGAPSWQPASRPTTAPQHQPPAAAPGAAQKRNPGGAHAIADYGSNGASQTGLLGEQKQGKVQAGLTRVWQEAVRGDAACGRGPSVLPPAPPLPTATQPAAGLATPGAHAAPVLANANAAGSSAPAYSQAAALTTSQPVNTVADVDHSAARGITLAAAHQTAGSKAPADVDAHAAIPGKCTSAALTAGSIASATNANVLSANCGQHSALAGQAEAQCESSAAQSSQAVVPGSGFKLVPPTTAAMPALQGTAGSNLSSLTAEHGLPAHPLLRFVSSASVSSKSEAAARHSSGLVTHPLSRQLSEAQAACGDRHAHSVSTMTSQAGTSLPQKAAGCALDPTKLKELESLHAAAQAAGLTPSWEDSENEDSDSSDSVFSGSGSGTDSVIGSGNGSGVASGQASFYTDVDEVAAGQSSQCGAAADSIARRTRNGGGGSCRAPASEQKRKGNKHITMQFLEEGGYFDAPIQAAAQQLKVGVTTLKKICRTAQVTRWPFRKRTSIERLIHRTQYFMTDGDDLEQKIAELQCLLAQREGLKACQAKDVDAPIKRFRQSMFKKVHLEEQEKRKAAKARKAEEAYAVYTASRAAAKQKLQNSDTTEDT